MRFVRANPSRALRRAVQLLVVAAVCYAAWQFHEFAAVVRSGEGAAARPPLAEAFLPIAAVVAFRGLLATGQFDPVHPAGLVILLATLATAWLFRRALCAWICPLGALSEALGALGRRLWGREVSLPRWLDRALLVLKYAVLAAAFKVFFLMPAGQALAFLRTPYYAVSDLRMYDLFARLGPFGAATIAALAALSVAVPSFWCRYLCPYGALLGALGVLSPVALIKDGGSCVHCRRCSRKCPNRVDVEAAGAWVASPECTGCTGCVERCPVPGTLEMRLLGWIRVRPLLFSAAFLAAFFGAVIWARATGRWHSTLTVHQYRVLDAAFAGQRGR